MKLEVGKTYKFNRALWMQEYFEDCGDFTVKVTVSNEDDDEMFWGVETGKTEEEEFFVSYFTEEV